MPGIVFEEQTRRAAEARNRADIACFAGLVARRYRDGGAATEPPPEVVDWLRVRGWIEPPYGRAGWQELLDLPVPVDNWDVFRWLFDCQARPGGAGTYLAGAVRSFFAQGGRNCYVIRAGDPLPLGAPRSHRLALVSRLVPGYPGTLTATPHDRSTWAGAAHLFGLDDASFLCLPDLPDLLAADPPPLLAPLRAPVHDQQWRECAEAEREPPRDAATPTFPAPRLEDAQYAEWAGAVASIASVLRQHVREVHLLAAVPMPLPGGRADRDLLRFLGAAGGPLAGALASAFVQLVYPWVRTPGSVLLPERLESPDGVLAGVLARSALLKGAFRSAAGVPLGDVYDVAPALRRDQMLAPLNVSGPRTVRDYRLIDRVSLLGPSPSGLVLLSDVTASLDESYRPAGVSRLVAAIARAARIAGEDLVFETSGPHVWGRLRESLQTMLTAFYRLGALRGATVADAFDVRCDLTTMTQNDLDNGRMVARIRFAAAAAIDTITVVLAVTGGGAAPVTVLEEAA